MKNYFKTKQIPYEGEGKESSIEISLVNEIIASTPEIREDKISDLKDKIELGTYTINPKAVAEKLVDAFIGNVI